MSSSEKAASSPQKPRRLLVVSQHFWPENFRISDIVEGFVERGIQVDVLCGLPNYPAGEWFEGYRYTSPRRQQYKGAEVFRSGEIRRKGNTSLRIFLNYASFPFFALFNLPRLWGRKYDAVLCYETSPVLMIFPAIVAARQRRIPLVTYVLDLWPDNLYSVLSVRSAFWRGVAQKVSDWHYRRSTRLIAMTGAMAQKLAEATRKPLQAIPVIPQYCEDFYAQDTPDPALQKQYGGTFNLLFAGNISPAQDLENLLQALKILHNAGHTDIRCLLLGDGMSKAPLTSLAAELGISDSFVFCGSCPPADIPRWTTLADALFAGLVSSENLGFTVPAKITSYFAAGRPMLVAADDEAARVSAESGAALVSPAGDSAALAANILELYHASPARRAEMGAAGRKTYYEHYTREKGLDALLDVIFP